jgi:hypothetical protein
MSGWSVQHGGTIGRSAGVHAGDVRTHRANREGQDDMGERLQVELDDPGHDGEATVTKPQTPGEFFWSEAQYRASKRIPDEVELEIDTELLRRLLREQLALLER